MEQNQRGMQWQGPYADPKGVDKMVSGIAQETGSSLFDTLRFMQKGQQPTREKPLTEDLTAQTLAATRSQLVSAHAASSNLISRNFASAERKESRYTQATIQGLQVNRHMNDSKQNTLMSIMQQAKMEYENAESLGEKYEALKRAEKKINWQRQAEVRESAEETHLKESKETLEEKVKEAMTPKDENGKPIGTGAPGGAGEAVSMPEISGSNPPPAPAPEVSAVPVPEVATVAISAPEVSTPYAPATPSIDITV